MFATGRRRSEQALRGQGAPIRQTVQVIDRPDVPDNHGGGLRRSRLFGLDFVDAGGIDEVVEALLAFEVAPAGQLSLVVTPNLDHLVQARHAGDRVTNATRAAAFVLPDGQPIVWSAGWFGESLSARLAGSDLFAAMWDRLSADQVDAVVIAPSEHVADSLRAKHPGSLCVVAPMIAADDVDTFDAVARDVVESLEGRRPRHVFVCLSQPKQLLLSLALLEAWPGAGTPPLCYCVGAAADMYVGLEQRAPAWMRNSGLEFLYRLVRNPRRLVGRYARDAAGFPRLLLAERRLRRESAHSV